MSWDRKSGTHKSYYYRNKRVDGHRVKEYVGRGRLGEQAALNDEKQRLQRQLDRQYWDSRLARIDQAEKSLVELAQVTTILVRAIMVTCGYHLHKGHEWRKRREHA
ncbi:hypothetical protein [Calycomorphotria hydatis]|uniref:Uncharacterized protein n=1 Tax=Calycomorphotria hydatis TaxID=2528027 RepID=A0A517TE21_9PLAN|nr:hypothetical protein [Calycomorphotria hydatis]QDT66618.1 hypothetical protein V22_38890 [Calycomorphotria hydatis]